VPDTVFLREEGQRPHASGLPPDVVRQSARRLRVLALLYAFVFFMADFFPMLFTEAGRHVVLENLGHWAPGALDIGIALVVAFLARHPRVPLRAVMAMGIAFEIASSYGIAAAEFLSPGPLDFDTRVGLSWVAVWVLLYSIAVPSSPRVTVLATLASISSVPVVVGLIAASREIPGLTPLKLFFGLVFPYLLVAVMAYVGARVIYALGKEVARARELGGYRLVELLGGGGMGEVWRAHHQLLARPAAIKLVKPELLGAHPERVQRQFEREAQATALMRSPHTIELFDFGVAADGTFYYVMELLDGFDLETLVDRFGPVPPERAISLLVQVCHSLGEAHEAGLTHRDIKPANVYACRYGREVDFVKVLDFGMVMSSEGEGTDARLTGDRSVWGTPAYMAPEQVIGDRPVDARTDVYAVGCVGYWLLTGQLVFTGRTAMEIMMQHTHEPPVPPSERTELAIPPALDVLLVSCLAKKPDERPASADALAAALSAIATPTPWTAARAREWWDLHHPRSVIHHARP
jgi:hypothetical protein